MEEEKFNCSFCNGEATIKRRIHGKEIHLCTSCYIALTAGQ